MFARERSRSYLRQLDDVMTETSELSLRSATKSLVIGASASLKACRRRDEKQNLPLGKSP